VVFAGPAEERAWLKVHLAAPAGGSRKGLVEHAPDADHASLLGIRHGDTIVRAVEWVMAARTAEVQPSETRPG
jgi:hypothetical protein